MSYFQKNRKSYPADIRTLIEEAALNPTEA